MPFRPLVFVAVLALLPLAAASALAQDSSRVAEQQLRDLLAPAIAAGHARDSLSAIADTARGEHGIMLEEQIWQRQVEFQNALLHAAEQLERSKAAGADLTPVRPLLARIVDSGWPRYLRQLDRRGLVILTLFAKRDAATPAQRLAIENEITEYSERTARMYRDLLEAVLAVERLGVDLSKQRAYLADRVDAAAQQTSARMVVLGRSYGIASARAQRSPDDAAARTELEGIEASFRRTTRSLETEIALLERLGVDATPLKVTLIVTTGKLTAAIFDPGVVAGLFAHWRQALMETLASRGAHWLFQGLVIALILAGFALLARLTRHVMRRATARAEISQLLKDTTVSWSSKLVMAIGFVFVLRQLGVQLGPMLAGLGIAGFVLGFALQDTLSNFAAGGMILAYHPYDIGDIIEAAGAMGTVQKMNLVSTTILTFDNQTLIVPNKKMWGDVIRNITAQAQRRVDLTFSVSYEADVAKVESLLRAIVDAEPRVLRDPPAIIRLHQLGDSAMQFVVRAWTRQAEYWDVYWDLTRAVKTRFDAEGVRIPFPQREVHVHMKGDRPGAVAE